ncbi:MAG: hypothetical protein Q4A05_09990 [Ruminococcus sp.]|nr:hypothetical protein [Ruminococcus sp.]
MSDIRRKAEEIMRRGDEMIAERKRRKELILRSCAIGVGVAAVLGVGLTTFALRPPKRPTAESSYIISETETTAETTTEAATAEHTTAKPETTQERPNATTSAGTSTAGTGSTTTAPARRTTPAARTTASASRTTAANTTTAVRTEPPTLTSVAPTTKDIEQRIADIVIKLPEMMPVVQALPAVNENGERIPTFPMLINDRTYMLILQYDRGELNFTFDLNDDGNVDMYDAFELEAYIFCLDQYARRGEYPYNFDEMFPDMEVFERAEDFYDIHRGIYVLTDYMLYHNAEIPDAETIEETAREYAGSRPFPNFVFTNLSKDVREVKDSFDKSYELQYEALNRKTEDYPDYQLEMFEKIDAGELFPDADRDGSIGYMDTYYMLKFYAEKSTGFSNGIFSENDCEWIEENCDLDGDGIVNAREASWLITYLFYYKKYDYVTHIEMEMEYRASLEAKDSLINIKPSK